MRQIKYLIGLVGLCLCACDVAQDDLGPSPDDDARCVGADEVALGGCLCATVNVDRENNLLTLSLSDNHGIWADSCRTFIALNRIDADGQPAAQKVANDIPNDCMDVVSHGCYVDGAYDPPDCGWQCDEIYVEAWTGEDVSLSLVEYVSLDAEPAPEGAEDCFEESSDDDADHAAGDIPAFETRPLRGQFRVSLSYYTQSDCGGGERGDILGDDPTAGLERVVASWIIDL